MTDPSGKRAEVTRQHILTAAAHQFAQRPYSHVSLDDILGDATVTKGAMYFHFRSKYALALAIIDLQIANARTGADEILARRLSGLETVVDTSYFIASQDTSVELARAAFNLIEGIGKADRLQEKLLAQWADGYAGLLRRAIDEGDVMDHVDADTGGRLLVSLYMGLRQASDVTDPRKFLADLEQAWLLTLPGLTHPDRIDYMTQFVKRRTARAIEPLLG